MRYEILGPIRVVHDNGAIHITSRRMQQLLSVLLARRGQVVTWEEIITEMYGEKPPKRARQSVHVHVSNLRRILRAESADDADRIVTGGDGYMLSVGKDVSDVKEFEDHKRRAYELNTAGRHVEAVHYLEAALGLWRGPVCVGLRDGPIVSTYAIWLDEAHIQCIETLCEQLLALGRGREVAGLLQSVVNEYPLRESILKLLMFALYSVDRQAEAIDFYHRSRRRLRDELGVDPCYSVRNLYQSIISGARTSSMSLGLPYKRELETGSVLDR